MQELKDIQSAVDPDEILLTIDAMTGQDAVNVAESFNEALGITGCVLTKTDGDTRGGAALSVKYVTDRPIKFMGTGEKLGDIEPFHPDRMASRILGMGDMLSLIEKAEKSFDEAQAKKLEEKIRKNQLDLNDFLDNMQQLKQMGPLDKMMEMIPGMNKGALKGVEIDEKQVARTEAIILSMTPAERENPDIINPSRKRRIAAGCGLTVEAVNRLLKSFDQTKTMMKKVPGMVGHKRGATKKKRKHKK
jgi:signal recognition particle subunit SRP54